MIAEKVTKFALIFSNSLIIDEVKTKEIITVKEVWKSDYNFQKKLVSFCVEFL